MYEFDPAIALQRLLLETLPQYNMKIKSDPLVARLKT